MPPTPPPARAHFENRWLARALLIMVVLGAAYTLVRAFSLRTEYYDGYEYLANAARLTDQGAGSYDEIRPPLLALLQAPVVAAARAAGPAHLGLLIGPHLLASLLSLLTSAALFFLYRRPLGTTLALLGVVLFMGTRFYVRYGAFALTDLPATGAVAAAMALHAAAWQQRSLGRYALCGLAAGAALAVRYPAGLALPALMLAEGLLVPTSCVFERRRWFHLAFDARRVLGVVIALVAAAAFCAAVMFVVYRTLHGEAAWQHLRAFDMKKISGVASAIPGEEPWDYLSMFATAVSLPLCGALLAGLLMVLQRPQRRDLPFVAWGLVMVGGTIYFMVHTEARYLAPALPALLYFPLRAAEAMLLPLRARWARLRAPTRGLAVVLLATLFGACLSAGARQIAADQDPYFTRDVARAAVAKMLQTRRDPGRAVVFGRWHTLSLRDPGPFPEDDFWNTFHVGPRAVSYLAGKSLPNWSGTNGSTWTMRHLLGQNSLDGDAILRLDDTYYSTGRYPAVIHIPRAMELWNVNRIDLRPDGQGGRFVSGDHKHGGRVELHEQTVFIPDDSYGDIWLFIATSTAPAPTFAGKRQLSAGVAIELWSPAPAQVPPPAEVTSLVLLRVTDEPVR